MFFGKDRISLVDYDNQVEYYENLQQELDQQSGTVRFVRFLGLLPVQCIVFWVSWKQHGLLYSFLLEFTKLELYETFLKNMIMTICFLVIFPIAVGYAILTLRRIAQHNPGFQRWIRARVPIV